MHTAQRAQSTPGMQNTAGKSGTYHLEGVPTQTFLFLY